MSVLGNLILLQTKYRFVERSDPKSTWIFLIVVVSFVALLIIAGAVRSRRGRTLDPAQRRKFNRYVFRKMAKDVGLQKVHIDHLEYLIRVCKVKQPFLIFSNSGLLDDILRKGIYSLDQSRNIKEEERDKRLSHIFQIKQLIERNSKRGIGIKSTNLLKPGQSVILSPESGGQFSSKVVSNMRDLLACAAPKNKAGHDFRWTKGTPLRAHFWRESDAGYLFQSKVLGYDTIKGVLCVLVQHSKTLRREQQRKFRRSALHRPCFIYPVDVVEVLHKRKTVRRAVVQTNRRLLGNLLDISGGGCSITAMSTLKQGVLIKMEFELNRLKRITVFGKVKRVRSQPTRGGIMHIMFTKLSSSYLNQIYSYVYDYTSQTAVGMGLRSVGSRLR